MSRFERVFGRLWLRRKLGENKVKIVTRSGGEWVRHGRASWWLAGKVVLMMGDDGDLLTHGQSLYCSPQVILSTFPHIQTSPTWYISCWLNSQSARSSNTDDCFHQLFDLFLSGWSLSHLLLICLTDGYWHSSWSTLLIVLLLSLFSSLTHCAPLFVQLL